MVHFEYALVTPAAVVRTVRLILKAELTLSDAALILSLYWKGQRFV